MELANADDVISGIVMSANTDLSSVTKKCRSYQRVCLSCFRRNWTKLRERLAYGRERGFSHGEAAKDVFGDREVVLADRENNSSPLAKRARRGVAKGT